MARQMRDCERFHRPGRACSAIAEARAESQFGQCSRREFLAAITGGEAANVVGEIRESLADHPQAGIAFGVRP